MSQRLGRVQIKIAVREILFFLSTDYGLLQMRGLGLRIWT
jgi:hypothetical protein